MRALAFLAAAALALPAGAQVEKVVPESTFKVLRAEFGTLDMKDASQPGFRPTTKVPLKDGQNYGWVIQLDTRKPVIRWREEFTLPAAPQSWGPAEKIGRRDLSADRRTSVTEREVKPARGLILNYWQVAAGDPRGRHVMKVFVEGVLVSTFEFDLE